MASITTPGSTSAPRRSLRMPSRRTSARLLAAGCVWFGLLALGRTQRMAEIVGSDEETIRTMGIRDLGSAVTLVLARDPRPALAARALFDFTDTQALARRRPLIAALAFAYGVAAVAAIAFGSRD